MRSFSFTFASVVGLLLGPAFVNAQPTRAELMERCETNRAVIAPNLSSFTSPPFGLSHQRFDFSKLVMALQQIDGVSAEPVIVSAPGADEFEAFVGQKHILIDLTSGQIKIADERRYDYDAALYEPPDEAVLFSRVSPLLEALGVSEIESIRDLRGLGAEDVLEDGTTTGVERVASKMMIQRQLAGVRFHSQKLVVSFAMDGSLRKVLGTWSSLDPERVATLPTSKIEDVISLGLDQIDARRAVRTLNIDPSPSRPLHVATYFATENPINGVYGVRLRAMIHVPVVAPDNGWKWSGYDYDLP